MKNFLSPCNLITITGGVLAFVGMSAYFTDSVNLSVPTFFYGVPILLIGLGLKTAEIGPAQLINKDKFKLDQYKRPKEITNLVADVTRWRYGQKAHLESSLESLKLWDEDNPPQLIELEEISKDGKKWPQNALHYQFSAF